MQFTILNELFLALLIGIVQGATEFLPISSTAHIRLITSIAAQGRDIGLTSSNVIQLGTLIAVFQYFKIDLKRYFWRIRQVFLDINIRRQFVYNTRAWLSGQEQFNGSSEERKVDVELIQLVIGTVPIIIIALLFGNFAQSGRDLQNIAVYLLAGSLLMYFGDRMHILAGNKVKNKTNFMTVGEIVLVGLFQSLAIFPGISRSGATIAGALMLGRNRGESVRFSFLLSIPAVLLAGLVDSFAYIIVFFNNPHFFPRSEFWSEFTISLSLISLILAVGAAYGIGYICLRWLLKYLTTRTTRSFIIYRVVLALLIFASIGFGWL